MNCSAWTVVASTIPATTIPAANRFAVSVLTAMLDAMIEAAWMVAEASNLNGTQEEPFHWEISPVADAIQMSFVLGVAGALAAMVVRVPPRVLTVMPWFSIAGVI